MKTCFKCGLTKSLKEFYRHKKMADGLLNKCKECTKLDVSRNREKNIEKIRKYDRGRNKLPHRIEARSAYEKQYRSDHPDRYKATNAVNNAVRGGRLERRPCLICGTTKSLEGHHCDYSRPLDVMWLCAAHHRLWHAF